MFDMFKKPIFRYVWICVYMVCPCIYVMCWYVICVIIYIDICLCDCFNGISTKMYYVFCEMRKWILVLTWILEFVTRLVEGTLDVVLWLRDKWARDVFT